MVNFACSPVLFAFFFVIVVVLFVGLYLLNVDSGTSWVGHKKGGMKGVYWTFPLDWSFHDIFMSSRPGCYGNWLCRDIMELFFTDFYAGPDFDNNNPT